MLNSVNLYLASGVKDCVGFWLINFTEDDDIINSLDSKLLECYRKEIFGIEAAIEVKDAIITTLDILSFESKIVSFKLDNSTKVYSSEIPLDIIEDIFDLWAYNYKDYILWKKYLGVLKFRKKIKRKNNYINLGLKGKTLDFAMKIERILSFRPISSSFNLNKSGDLMW
tara:strand:+ start:1332 stop:1838 length:507 start_codon:yes stop_codon:yes gene_type:complete